MAPFALESLRYFGEAGYRSPDLFMVRANFFILLHQDPRPASQLLDPVLVKTGKIAAVADDLLEGDTHFDFSEPVLIEKLSGPDLVP